MKHGKIIRKLRKKTKKMVNKVRTQVILWLYQSLGTKEGEKPRDKEKFDRWETKKWNSSKWQPIWFYALDGDNGSDILTIMCEWAIQMDKKDWYLIFIDLKKACDKVYREILWKICIKIVYIDAIEDMFDGV